MQRQWTIGCAALAALVVLNTGDGRVSSSAQSAGASAGDAVLVGAGDIGLCGSPGSAITAGLLDGISGTVFTAGDNTEDQGTEAEFTDCYDPSWGRHKSRTRPAPGNHDYDTPGASAYYRYFGSAAGDPARGYYSYDLGAWHVLALNSNCGEAGGCAAGSPQERWVRADLAASAAECVLAYWHHPRFFSPTIGDGAVPPPSSDRKMMAIWRALQAAGADVVVAGHRQVHERFAPMNDRGAAVPGGIRQFLVGTGGDKLDTFDQRHLAPNSLARIEGRYGVIKFTLRPDAYDWEFLTEDGTVQDTGTDSCRTPSTTTSDTTTTTTAGTPTQR